MKRRIVILLLVVLGVGFLANISFAKERDTLYEKMDIFAEALAMVEKRHVEDKTPQDLIYGALAGLLSSLDSYSQFLTPEEYADLLTETEGEFGGLGIEITIKDNLLTIVSPIEDTPAWEAGLKAGDVIVKIEGEVTKGITLSEAVKKLRGEPGSEVNITVLREKDRKVEDVTIVRGIIKIKDIKRALILEDRIGYIKVAEFRERTVKDFDKELKKLKEEGIDGLIIDVRNNPGGLLYSAIEASSRFLEDGKTVVSTKSKTKKEMVYKSLPARQKFLDIPLVVVINKGSASGSEILAAALRDNNRAILLGEKTFGKGSVQTIVPLSDGSALRLTTSKYYTPAGEAIHEEEGVTPDIEIVEEERKIEDVFEELKKKEDFDYRHDNQLVRALDLIKGILVLKEKKELREIVEEKK
ncbi:MAG: S41 family peptidase [Candidatus Omnitrophota bacterium]|nr:MAG: S41 family peptidase [Candidatus Omnitrophota bacterium]